MLLVCLISALPSLVWGEEGGVEGMNGVFCFFFSSTVFEKIGYAIKLNDLFDDGMVFQSTLESGGHLEERGEER